MNIQTVSANWAATSPGPPIAINSQKKPMPHSLERNSMPAARCAAALPAKLAYQLQKCYSESRRKFLIEDAHASANRDRDDYPVLAGDHRRAGLLRGRTALSCGRAAAVYHSDNRRGQHDQHRLERP